MQQICILHAQDAGALTIGAPLAAVLAEAEATLPDLVVQLHVDERAECYKVNDVGVLYRLLKIVRGDATELALIHFAADQSVHLFLFGHLNHQA